MTHTLQPMDLIVNSVVKSAMRRYRIQHLMGYFKQYRADYHNALRGHRDLPMYNPPAPTIIDGIKGMFDLREEYLLNDKFQLSVQRVFQSVGLCPLVTPNDPVGFFAT